MQVTETLCEGLKRELKIVIPADELDKRLTDRLETLKDEVQIKGFRPGKVPAAHLRRTFGARIMPEIVEKAVTESSAQALKDRDERPALQPKISLTEDEAEIKGVMAGEADLAYTMEFEIIPAFEVMDLSKIELVRQVAQVNDAIVDEALDTMASQQKDYAPRDDGAKAEDGDRLTIDFAGRVDGEEFEGGKAEGVDLVLGSGGFIPGFEEQLIGIAAPSDTAVKVTFPEDYEAKALAGKDAVFDVKVKVVAAPKPVVIDDEFAKRFGMDDLAKLREAVKGQVETEFAQASRAKLKRELLDALDKVHTFELPSAMVEGEFDAVWKSVNADMERRKSSFEDEGTTEEDATTEYREISERRVRLGLVIADIGDKNQIKVEDEEVNRALMERLRQFPGQEREAYEFYQKTPQAMAELRAPIFEDKVVDFILELATVSEKTVSREELFKDEDDETDHSGHDHG
ncbi:Cell division trigger factor [hydrothermal vent metagenome]|uniref:peptidylprolyl isomerase n=1 Tax=hydrothermal vent metagenome TaxID=652676 RepID=A0A3B0TWG0_9ZZZZ